jgi:hypothetical protein
MCCLVLCVSVCMCVGHEQKWVGNDWNDWNFLTDLLKTLRMAVLDEDPSAQTTMNFHTDVSKKFHDLSFIRGFYLDAMKDWLSLMDFVTLDAYPNMVVATPIETSILGDRIRQIRSVVGDEKVIFVMETGYPVDAVTNTSAPVDLQFTEELQCEYINTMVTEVLQAGGNGVLLFGIWKSKGMSPPGGFYTEEDAEAMKLLGEAYLDDRAAPLLEWALLDGMCHLQECYSSF